MAMRLAIISDIHGNIEALQQVLIQIRNEGVDSIACLGDIAGYGPFPNECIDLVRKECSTIIGGNHDAGAVGTLSSGEFNKEGKLAIEWTRTQLTLENRDWLMDLFVSTSVGDVTLVHASPEEPEKWHYVSTCQLYERSFKHFESRFCCIGHTHIPAIVSPDRSVRGYAKGQRLIIMCGSGGHPRDGDPRASFAILDTDNDSASIIRVPYDVAKTADAIRAAGLPEFLAKRLTFGI